MIFQTAVYICLAVVIGCANCLKPRIIGGELGAINNHPYLVSLRWTYGQPQPMHFCGGTIVGAQHVLTAAHCVHEYLHPSLQQYIRVCMGSSRTDGGGWAYPVQSIVIHPSYQGERDFYLNDIAVIKLTQPIQVTQTQAPVSLPKQPAKDGGSAIVTGWGLTSPQAANTPVQFGKATVQLINSVRCRTMLPYAIQPTQICARQQNGGGICTGDSGSPLVANKEIIGIASYVLDCAKGYPDVYTNVFAYLDFIAYAMAL